MSYNILVVYYSQTNRTREALDLFLGPLKADLNVRIDSISLEPERPYPYPWPKLHFFSIMPETVDEVSVALTAAAVEKGRPYDLIVLGCPVWFLSPAPPISSFLRSPEAAVFSGAPVITLLTCRKMWKEAQQSIDDRLKELGGRPAGRIVVTAEGSQMRTLRRTRDNLFIARKDNAGAEKTAWRMSDAEREYLVRMGSHVAGSLEQLRTRGAVPALPEQPPVAAGYVHAHAESVAKRSFRAWARFMRKHSAPESGKRYVFTFVFTALFLLRIFIGLPIFELLSRAKAWKRQGGKTNALTFD